MDTGTTARLTVALSEDRTVCDGAWWPRSRILGTELVDLFQAWPADAGLISRACYCPRDWDDAPVGVPIPLRHGRLRTGLLPSHETHRLQLVMLDGRRRTLVVLPHDVPSDTASHYLLTFGRSPDTPPRTTAAGHPS